MKKFFEKAQAAENSQPVYLRLIMHGYVPEKPEYFRYFTV